MMRRIWTLGAGIALAVVAVLALGGLSQTRAADSAPAVAFAGQPAPGQQAPPERQDRPRRRELLEALARLAGVSPRELQRAAEEHGGLLPALQSLGVTDDQVRDLLAEQALRRFEPAIAEGRLSREQAEQLARRQANRLLRRLGGMSPRGR
jgi:hypothetical protein